MKNRLIELLQKADKKCNDTKQCENCVGYGEGNECVNHLIADCLIANGVVIIDPVKFPPVTNRGIIDQVMGMPLDEMAELIKAKQEGRIIIPPCKVGDTVYRIVNLYNGETIITEGHVYEFAITHEYSQIDKYRFYFYSKSDDEYTSRRYSLWCEFTDFGKTVFFTRDEAEKALAERGKS